MGPRRDSRLPLLGWLFFFFSEIIRKSLSYKVIYLVIFGWARSLVLCAGFLWLWRAGAVLCCGGFSLRGLLIAECRLQGAASVAAVLCSMWGLPGPGVEPASPAL